MANRKIRYYDKEFKENAILLYKERGESYRVVAESLGIPSATLAGWVQAKKQLGEEAFPGKGHLVETEERYQRLVRENERLKRERDILKKALAIFSLA